MILFCQAANIGRVTIMILGSLFFELCTNLDTVLDFQRYNLSLGKSVQIKEYTFSNSPKAKYFGNGEKGGGGVQRKKSADWVASEKIRFALSVEAL